MPEKIKEEVPDKSISFGPTDYFIKSLLPLTVHGAKRVITKVTPRVQNEDELIMLITAGCGTIVINHEEYKISRGTMLCLGPYHNYSVRPEAGSTIELMEGHTNSSAYMYILSCPYLKVKQMAVPAPPVVKKLEEKDIQDVKETLEMLCKSSVSKDYYNEKLSFFYIIKLFGVLMSNEHGKQEKGSGSKTRKTRDSDS